MYGVHILVYGVDMTAHDIAPQRTANAPTAERMLDTARKILLDEGSEAISMRRVAEGAGVTTMATYRHFANRQALLDELARREFAQLATDPAATWDGDPDRVGLAVDAHLNLALNRPHLYAFLFTERREGARRYPADMRAGLSPTLNVLVEGLRAARRRGAVSFADEWEIAMIIAAQLHGLVQLRHGGRINLEEADFRQLCARAVGVVLNGLRP